MSLSRVVQARNYMNGEAAEGGDKAALLLQSNVQVIDRWIKGSDFTV